MPPSAKLVANQIATADNTAVTKKPLYIAPMIEPEFAEAHEIGADDRGDHAHATDQQGQAHQREQLVAGIFTSSAISTIVAPMVTT